MLTGRLQDNKDLSKKACFILEKPQNREFWERSRPREELKAAPSNITAMPPVGFKRSRALWDDARRPRPGRKNEEWMSLFRAILYELQPIRFSEYNVNPNALAAFFSTRVLPTIRYMGTLVTRVWLPSAWSIIRDLSARQWMIVGGIFVYYFVVRWIHE